MYSKIIARDLRLVASRLYRMAVTRPRVTCRRYIIPLFRRRPPGLHKPFRRKGKESIKQSCRVRTGTNSKVRLPIGTAHDDLSADPAHGETPPPLGCDPEVVKTCADAICTGLRSKKVKKYGEEKRREETEERNAQLITFLRSRVLKLYVPISSAPESRTSIPPYLHSQTLPASNVPCGSYLGVLLGRNHQGGTASAHNLASMGASAAGIFVAIGNHRSYTSIV